MMSYPTNFNHPQPLRIWPVPEEGRGDVFASFSPTRDTDWLLSPGNSYTLNYRFIVYNGHMNAERADSDWKNYIRLPEIKIIKN
jgi:hypothetical protein